MPDALQNHAQSPPEDYVFSGQIGHLLRRAYQRHTAHFQHYIPDSELTTAQFVVLCALRDSDGVSLADVVKATVIDQATLRGVIERLRQRALIAVAPGQADRRKVVIHLTPAGRDLVREMAPFAQQISASTYGTLNAAERVAMDFLLRKMLLAPT